MAISILRELGVLMTAIHGRRAHGQRDHRRESAPVKNRERWDALTVDRANPVRRPWCFRRLVALVVALALFDCTIANFAAIGGLIGGSPGA